MKDLKKQWQEGPDLATNGTWGMDSTGKSQNGSPSFDEGGGWCH